MEIETDTIQSLHSDPYKFTGRGLTPEELVRRQEDRIAFLRSTGQDFSEAVFELRDQLVGLEDLEFFDGIPEVVRQHFLNCDLTKNVNAKGGVFVDICPHIPQESLEQYLNRGWDTMPCRSRELPDGRTVLDPAPAELAVMRRTLRALLARRGKTWVIHKSSEVPTLEWSEEE